MKIQAFDPTAINAEFGMLPVPTTIEETEKG